MRKLASLIIITTMLFVSVIKAETPRITVIKAGRLVDPEKAVVLENQLILIENNLIKAVGTNLKIPEGAIVIDLSNSYVLPGFIDAHVHLTSETDGNYYDNLFRRSFVDSAITAHLNAKATLDAGFTSVRNLGADAFIDVALKNLHRRCAEERDQLRKDPGSADADRDLQHRGDRKQRGGRESPRFERIFAVA